MSFQWPNQLDHDIFIQEIGDFFANTDSLRYIHYHVLKLITLLIKIVFTNQFYNLLPESLQAVILSDLMNEDLNKLRYGTFTP